MLRIGMLRSGHSTGATGEQQNSPGVQMKGSARTEGNEARAQGGRAALCADGTHRVPGEHQGIFSASLWLQSHLTSIPSSLLC